jgi:hypothetical protein
VIPTTTSRENKGEVEGELRPTLSSMQQQGRTGAGEVRQKVRRGRQERQTKHVGQLAQRVRVGSSSRGGHMQDRDFGEGEQW